MGVLMWLSLEILTAFNGSRRLLRAEEACNIGWNTLSVGLSRLRQGFESPWGRHLKIKAFQTFLKSLFAFCPENGAGFTSVT